MDGMNLLQWIKELLQKYRYVTIILIVGLVLMLLPEGPQGPQEDKVMIQQSEPLTVQEELAEILSQLEGAGCVRVLLTEAAGESTLYQTDEDSGGDSMRLETIILTDSERGESGLIRQINPPVYQGAVILCQGADSASVRLQIVEAVSNATGLTADKISVLKMK